uniref:Schwannomin interacting protein 1 C-terminal domain-containing protein n=1 Tax=Parascaris univalens TaxID=6257 RepID=A0A915BYI6_PARUN
MWSSEAVLPIESNNNICAYSLFSSLVEEEGAATASPTDQHSNSSSLESLDSPLLDDNRALSTSCSENSFEMSSTASRNAGDLPTPSDSLRFCRDSLKHSCDHQLEPDPETKPGSEPSPQMKQLPREEAFKELRSDHCEMIENPIQCIDCKCKPHPKTAQSGTGVREVLNIKSCPTVGATSNGHINCKVESNHAANFRDGWKINSEAEVEEISEVNELLPEASTRERLISATSSTASGSASGGTYSFALYDHACRPPSTSKSMGSIGSSFSSKEALQKSIDAEVKSLDTRLPELDFNKLEEQLNCAAKERQIIERKLLGEQVRRRLALQVDQLTAGPSPRILTRPSRSNLGFRLQTAMNLQVCYMNDMDEEDLDDESSDDDFGVPKSKSAPNLRGQVPDGSNMNATQLRQQIASNECTL